MIKTPEKHGQKSEDSCKNYVTAEKSKVSHHLWLDVLVKNVKALPIVLTEALNIAKFFRLHITSIR